MTEPLLERIRALGYRACPVGAEVKIEGHAPMSVHAAETFAAWHEAARPAQQKVGPVDPVMWVERDGRVFWSDCTAEEIARLLPIINASGIGEMS